MPTNRTDLPDLTWKVLVNMDLQVEKRRVEEEKQKELELLRKKVIDVLDILKISTAEEIRLMGKVRLREEDIKNITSKQVLIEILRLNNETNIQE